MNREFTNSCIDVSQSTETKTFFSVNIILQEKCLGVSNRNCVDSYNSTKLQKQFYIYIHVQLEIFNFTTDISDNSISRTAKFKLIDWC